MLRKPASYHSGLHVPKKSRLSDQGSGSLTDDLPPRTERALSAAAQSRLSHIQQLPGNPLGIELRQWEHLSASLVGRDALYYHYFNAIRDVRPGDQVLVDEAIAWFRSYGKACRLSLSLEVDLELRDHLVERGLRQSRFMTVQCAVPVAIKPPPPNRVRVQMSQGPSEPFLALWLDGATTDEREFLCQLARAEFADWLCFVAFVEARPAAFAALYVTDGMGVMASAWTAPEFRRQGCHSALLRERIIHAADNGNDLLVGQAMLDSQSQRNMERMGLPVAYTQAIWTDGGAGGAGA